MTDRDQRAAAADASAHNARIAIPTRDEVSRYDRLSPAARTLLENHDELDLAEMLARAEALLAAEQPVRDQLAAAINALGKSETELAGLRATLATVTALYEQWVKAGPPPLGASMARWWDRRLVELHHAIRPTAEQPARTTQDNPAGSSQEHVYLSTGCLHGDHAYCESMTGLGGAKRPASCKKCGARCICPCHQQTEPPVHIGGQANAEDCPACTGSNPDYPFVCPGPDTEQPRTTANNPAGA